MNKNIYIDGTYLKNNPDWNEKDAGWKAETIHNLLQKNNIKPQNVIEIGCGAGGILEALSHQLPDSNFIGYDISPQAIEIALKKEKANLHFKNIDNNSNDRVEKADLCLVIDVIEHVADYYDFLQLVKTKAGLFIFHIPLDLSSRTILKPHVLLQQRNAVGHIHYFSKEIVLWALKDKNYTVIDWHYTKPIIDTDKAKSIKQKIKKTLRNFSFGFNKDLSAKLWGGYSMLILAK